MHPSLHARTNPTKPAFIMAGTGETITYGELEHRSNQCARLIRNCGLAIGDAIAVCMDNTPYYFEIAWAAQRAGLYFTTISSRLTAPEVRYIVEDCGAKAVFLSSSQAHIAEELATSLAKRCELFAVPGGIYAYRHYLAEREGLGAGPIDDQASGVEMLYSSGTTGKPKGIHTNLSGEPFDGPLPLAELFKGLYGFDEETVYLSPAPLYHAAPLRFNMIVQRFNGTCIVMEKFDAEESLRLVEKFRVTHSQWVPTMFVRMLKLDSEVRNRFDLSSSIVAVHAAAPCPAEVKRKMIDWWGEIIFEYYAGSEANGLTAITSAQWLENPGSVGKPVLGVPHILDDEGNELPCGEAGVIYFADGPEFSYHNDPQKTAESRISQGWSTLGDIGYLNEKGYLFLTDRKANMIISGGVNIYPQEAENVLINHPAVLDVAVIGVPNEDFGEEVKAVVQPVDMGSVSSDLEQELIAYCRAHLSSIKSPRSVDFTEELPRHPNGKLYKRLLIDKYKGKSDSRIV